MTGERSYTTKIWRQPSSIGFSSADALSTSMDPLGEPVISTQKRPCQKIQNGSEFPELVAQNSRNPQHWFQPRIFRILFVKPRNRPTDSQRLRRNVLREIHEHSALDRMLFLPGQRFGKPSPLRAAARIETRTSTKSAFFSQLDYFRIARDQEQSGD